MKELAGKVAVVTGAAHGIGRAMAERFAAEGMRVVVSDYAERPLRDLERALLREGTEVISVTCDVTSEEDNEYLASRTFERFGGAHLLCLNAGVGTDLTTLWNQTRDSWEWVLGANLWGVIHGVHAFMPRMLEQADPSRVIISSSMSGLFAMPINSAYHVAKYAVQGYAECLHFELEKKKARVSVSVLCPGMVRTRFMETSASRPKAPGEAARTSQQQEWIDAYTEMIGSGLPPEEVAGHVIDAVREDKFWIFPSTAPLGAVSSRTEDILAQRNPRLALTETLKKKLKL